MSSTQAASRWRVHWVVVELDAHGEIDAHAAMCLRQAIGEAHAGAIELVLVDLRDLTAINSAGLALLTTFNAGCQAHGMDLGLLIRSGGVKSRDVV
jgi:anti-anti-sigma factor